MSKYPLGDWLTSVNFSKEDLRDREDAVIHAGVGLAK